MMKNTRTIRATPAMKDKTEVSAISAAVNLGSAERNESIF
jgi:hypothetical protein